MKRLCLGAAAFALVCLALFTGLSHAADRVDQMNRDGVVGLCANAMYLFDNGVWARSIGIARQLKQAPPGTPQVVASADDVPKDAMTHDQWDKFTDQERAFTQKHIFAGYDAADKMISDYLEKMKAIPDNDGFILNGNISDAARRVMNDEYFNKCLQTETGRRTFKKTNFHKTASGQALAEPKLNKERECSTWYDSAAWVMSKVRSGIGESQFWGRYKLPDYPDAAYSARVRAMVDKAYANPGEPGEFAHSYYQACMKDWKDAESAS